MTRKDEVGTRNLEEITWDDLKRYDMFDLSHLIWRAGLEFNEAQAQARQLEKSEKAIIAKLTRQRQNDNPEWGYNTARADALLDPEWETWKEGFCAAKEIRDHKKLIQEKIKNIFWARSGKEANVRTDKKFTGGV